MCPDACSNVCRDVRVEFAVFDRTIGHVVVEPPTRCILIVRKPCVRSKGSIVSSHDVESNRRLNVVPRVAMSVGVPRNHSVGELQSLNGISGLCKVCGREDARKMRTILHHADAPAMNGLVEYTMKLLPRTGLKTRSAMRMDFGPSMMSHSSSLRYFVTSG
ncbi:unannotated protein [freshwater metagenome]|uniref:Unannotated protein n=1 Tax=freshwater metagenome TaxID=449393 RepID=A0A6J6H646_9ZZZZ